MHETQFMLAKSFVFVFANHSDLGRKHRDECVMCELKLIQVLSLFTELTSTNLNSHQFNYSLFNTRPQSSIFEHQLIITALSV